METKETPKKTFGNLQEGPSAGNTKRDDDIVFMGKLERNGERDVEPEYTDLDLNFTVYPYRCKDCKQLFRRVFRFNDPRLNEGIPTKCRLCRTVVVKSPIMKEHYEHIIKSGGIPVYKRFVSYLSSMTIPKESARRPKST